MAESALEKIMRLKREREASGAAGADSSPKALSSPKLETTLRELQTNLPAEKAEELIQAVEKIEVEVKQLNAMERLRQLKMGTYPEVSSPVSPVSSTASPPPQVSAPIQTPQVQVKEEVQKVLKEAKTHPIAMEMAELEAALDAEVPGFVTILSAIHKKLRLDPNCVTLLDDEEIGVIVAGLEKHTNVTIVSPNAVKAAKKASKVPVSASDL